MVMEGQLENVVSFFWGGGKLGGKLGGMRVGVGKSFSQNAILSIYSVYT